MLLSFLYYVKNILIFPCYFLAWYIQWERTYGPQIDSLLNSSSESRKATGSRDEQKKQLWIGTGTASGHGRTPFSRVTHEKQLWEMTWHSVLWQLLELIYTVWNCFLFICMMSISLSLMHNVYNKHSAPPSSFQTMMEVFREIIKWVFTNFLSLWISRQNLSHLETSSLV